MTGYVLSSFLPRPDEVETSVAVGADGVNIVLRRWGNPHGPVIVFIHGFAQCGLAFARQMRDERLSAKYHLIAYDLRGHGASDKPLDPDAYRDGRLWAQDLRAVLRCAGADRPLLVGWSYGGRIVWDYLREYGESSVAGAQLVGSSWVRRPEWESAVSAAYLPLMLEAELATNIAATSAYLASCFATPPPADQFAQMLAYNMTQPPHARRAMVGRARQPEEFIASLELPISFVVGAKDAHCAPGAVRACAERMVGATMLTMPDVGHSPFYEAADAFGAQLDAFATRVFSRAA